MARRDLVSEINHRLAVVESIEARVALLTGVNERLIALAGLQGSVIDLRVLAANVQQVADMVVQRLAATEHLLDHVSRQLAVRSRND